MSLIGYVHIDTPRRISSAQAGIFASLVPYSVPSTWSRDRLMTHENM